MVASDDQPGRGGSCRAALAVAALALVPAVLPAPLGAATRQDGRDLLDTRPPAGAARSRDVAKPQPPDARAADVAPKRAVSPDPADAAEVRPELPAVRQWLAELDDADSTVREQARVKLMGMRRRDLTAFRKLVEENRPLMPAQAAVLREIVMHVFLSGEQYNTTGAQGFLGVKMQETDVRLPGAGANRGMPAVGVVIVERMPGFVGSRVFLDGDVILGVAERQNVRPLNVNEFQGLVQQITPGSTVHFQILRQGQLMRVPVTVDPRPFESEPFILNQMIQRRQEKAQEYWDHTFAPALKESIG